MIKSFARKASFFGVIATLPFNLASAELIEINRVVAKVNDRCTEIDRLKELLLLARA